MNFADLIEKKAARLMPDVCRANGTRRSRSATSPRRTASWCHRTSCTISLHVVGTLANGFLVEFMDWAPLTSSKRFPSARRPSAFRALGHGMALARGAIDKYRTR